MEHAYKETAFEAECRKAANFQEVEKNLEQVKLPSTFDTGMLRASCIELQSHHMAMELLTM
jgi:hypothetical protein